ncbi:unnamed protein product [Cuscuta epithymum]|uniref:SWIM-type domain-containing protein n=1 Tax=Cuscuta epithymum TaxID=186058 RepID=A0AAV0GLS1_9ASTE|nr:unnamed protein product [Cuscuta epithymum]
MNVVYPEVGLSVLQAEAARDADALQAKNKADAALKKAREAARLLEKDVAAKDKELQAAWQEARESAEQVAAFEKAGFKLVPVLPAQKDVAPEWLVDTSGYENIGAFMIAAQRYCGGAFSDVFSAELEKEKSKDRLRFGVRVKPATQFEFEVVDTTSRSFVVDLKAKTCSCCEFQLEQFICVHGVAVVCNRRGLSCYDYISKYYFTQSWVAAYSGAVHPIGSLVDWDIPASVRSTICKPPTCDTRQPGRPKKKRIPSTGEFSSRQRCSRCKKDGHNKKSCRNPLSVRRV